MVSAWAVYRHGQKVSKDYPHREQALIDAVERKFVWNAAADFGYAGGPIWCEGCEIREVKGIAAY